MYQKPNFCKKTGQARKELVAESNIQNEKVLQIPEGLPRDLTYYMAISALIFASKPDKKSEILFNEKVKALKKAWTLLELYARESIDNNLLDVIMEKKARKILNSSSVKDIREIANPPKPQYTGYNWIISENSVPEEELILWSKTSLKAPLKEEATKRYMELFRGFYGDKADEFLGEIGG